MTNLPDAPSKAFASDNAAGAHPSVIEAVISANVGDALAYGSDDETARLERRFSQVFGRPVVSRVCFNGTGANVLALATMMGAQVGPHPAIVCTNWSHIAADETGAPERVLGTKLIELPSSDAKITPAMLRSVGHLQGVQHHVQPGIVSITQPTELGTLYSPAEISDLCTTAHEMGMTVHLDGARLANATAALGGDLDALRSFTVDAGVDVVSFGGTKNGAMSAEAVVFLDPDLAVGSEFVRKQVTQLPSKMRYLSAQMNALLEDDLWIRLGDHSNAMATRLHEFVSSLDGVGLGAPPAVNSLFPTLPPDVIEPLREWCFFWDWDPTIHQVRWMTAWDTSERDVERFADGVRVALSASRH